MVQLMHACLITALAVGTWRLARREPGRVPGTLFTQLLLTRRHFSLPDAGEQGEFGKKVSLPVQTDAAHHGEAYHNRPCMPRLEGDHR
jgi:hypothetical protein